MLFFLLLIQMIIETIHIMQERQGLCNPIPRQLLLTEHVCQTHRVQQGKSSK